MKRACQVAEIQKLQREIANDIENDKQQSQMKLLQRQKPVSKPVPEPVVRKRKAGSDVERPRKRKQQKLNFYFQPKE